MGVQNSYVSATSAFRNASNGQLLADEIYQKTRLKVNIIDGEQEANLIYMGVKQALDLGSSNSLIIDIGGGSVEFIIANHKKVQWLHSFEIGAQRLMDQFHHHDPISRQEITSLESFLDMRLASLIPAMEQYHPSTLIGASGSFDTLSHIHCLKQGFEKSDNPEQPLTIAGFNLIHDEIIVKNRSERLKIPGMIEMRADMIVVASCLIDYILNRFSLSNIRVSSYALKEGVLYDVVKVRAQLG
jgi:exopolyphosphatase/guanosine-5'-triphosphate,3'-diphosphate pyrophosphatase